MKKVVNFLKEFGPAIAIMALPAVSFAAIPPPGGFVGSGAPQASITSMGGVLTSLCSIFTWIFIFLLVLAGIFILIAAFKYLTASGDPEKVKSAGTMLIYTAVAIGVALLARAIPFVVASFLGTSVAGFTC